MSEPCIQGPTIQKMDAKLDKVLDALQEMARQKVMIDGLVEKSNDHHSWLKGHERRIQGLESVPGKIAGKTLVMMGTAFGAMVAGVTVYFLTH